MLHRLRNVALIGSIGLIGADRMNLLTGMGSFTLTPFLFLAPITIALDRVPSLLHGKTVSAVRPETRRQLRFLPPAYLLIIVLLASVLFGIEPVIGLVRVIGLVLVAGLAYCMAAIIVSDPAPKKLIVPSVGLALVVHLVFCVGEYISFMHGNFLDTGQTVTWHTLFAPMWIANLTPRYSGPTVDANRAGFVLTMYLVLLDNFAPASRHRGWMRFAIIVFVVITMSRSAVFCWLAYEAVRLGTRRRMPSRGLLTKLTVLVLLLASLAYIYREQLTTLAELWRISNSVVATRLDTGQSSSVEDHIELIQRGIYVWRSSPETVILGNGYGAGYKFLGDFFGDNKYGNFHCLYVTFLADSGLLGLLLLMTLLCYPFVARRGASGALAAILVFNIGYQSHMEPMFWLVLALLWSFEPRQWPRWMRVSKKGDIGGVAPRRDMADQVS